MTLRRSWVQLGAALAASAIMAATAMTATASQKGVVNTTDANVRAKASTTADVVTTAEKGDTLTLGEAREGWYKVTVHGKTGYIRADKVDVASKTKSSAKAEVNAATAKSGDTVYVDKKGVNLRSRANTDADVVKKLAVGDALKVMGTSGEWYKVSSDGTYGYVRADLTASQKPSDANASKSQDADATAEAQTEAKTEAKPVGPVVHNGDDARIPDITGLDDKTAAKVEAAAEEEDHEAEDETVTEPFDIAEPNIGQPGIYAVAPESANDPSQNLGIGATSAGGMSADGTSADGASADGTAPDGTAPVGAISDGTSAEGTSADASNQVGIPAAGDATPPSGSSLAAAIDSTLSSKPMTVNEMQRDLSALGFYTGKEDGKVGTWTLAALKSFQRAYDIEVDGKLGQQTIQTIRAALSIGGNGRSAARVRTSHGVILSEWFNYMRAHFPKYVSLKCVDVATGESFHLRAFSCGNHADVEPPTKADTEIIKRINGGKWAWTPRAIWVYIEGQPYAAAINVMPHGPDTLPDNGMSGQICMHFLHSRQHNTGQENKNLQAAVLNSFAQADKAPSK